MRHPGPDFSVADVHRLAAPIGAVFIAAVVTWLQVERHHHSPRMGLHIGDGTVEEELLSLRQLARVVSTERHECQLLYALNGHLRLHGTPHRQVVVVVAHAFTLRRPGRVSAKASGPRTDTCLFIADAIGNRVGVWSVGAAPSTLGTDHVGIDEPVRFTALADPI